MAPFRIGLINLIPGQVYFLTDFGQYSRPKFSPDDSQITYEYSGDIWVMKVDGSDKRQLTNDFKYEG